MTYEQFLEQFHINLTSHQLAAVKSISNPTLLLAVPGSGKTTTLVTRLGYMIHCCGIPPENILTLTYTVAATRDMQRRFAMIFGEELAARLEFRTINGICAKILGYYGNMVGKKAFDLVTDESFKARLISSIYLDIRKEYPTESDLKNISTLITYIKNMQLNQAEIEALEESIETSVSHIKDIYNAYCAKMRSQSLMDYDDQMVYALLLLQKDPRVLEYFQNLYRYICVDEAQDTSKIQHRIISQLAGRYENLFMVGDEDQSIYGFRAAYPEALLAFEQDHSGAQVLLMEENFRSTANIVSAADRFIQKNQFRHKKEMKPTRESGREIRRIPLQSRRSQYAYLAKVAKNCNGETAVLYRDNESILPVVDLLEREGVDYRMKNADLTFFSHRIIVDIENIIRFAAEPTDTELFAQIYYKIGTYLSKAAAMDACRYSEEKGIPVLSAALACVEIPEGTRKSVKAIQTHLEGLLHEKADKAIYRIVHFMGYGAYLERMRMKDDKLSILSAIASNEPSALRLVERLRELAQIMREKQTTTDCSLIFSTIHSSKGLEYDAVYLMDVKDGIFPETVLADPKQASLEEWKAYEEERRLFYVGVTRAREQLFIFTFPEKGTFTDELLGKKNIARKSVPDNRSTAPQNIVWYREISGEEQRKRQGQRTITESEYLDKLEELQTTGYVKHKKYGEGRVLSIKGDTIEIEFEQKVGKYKLMFLMQNQLIE